MADTVRRIATPRFGGRARVDVTVPHKDDVEFRKAQLGPVGLWSVYVDRQLVGTVMLVDSLNRRHRFTGAINGRAVVGHGRTRYTAVVRAYITASKDAT